MHIRRRLQLGSVAVIANGLLALTLLSAPHQALANPCAEQLACVPPGGTCNNNLALCQLGAKPGCTATGSICGGPGCQFPTWQRVICEYN